MCIGCTLCNIQDTKILCIKEYTRNIDDDDFTIKIGNNIPIQINMAKQDCNRTILWESREMHIESLRGI